MSNCMFSNCLHYGKTSCTITIVDGIWKCTREMDGKTFIQSTSTVGTDKMTDGETKEKLLRELKLYAQEIWHLGKQMKVTRLTEISEELGDCAMSIGLAWDPKTE